METVFNVWIVKGDSFLTVVECGVILFDNETKEEAIKEFARQSDLDVTNIYLTEKEAVESAINDMTYLRRMIEAHLDELIYRKLMIEVEEDGEKEQEQDGRPLDCKER